MGVIADWLHQAHKSAGWIVALGFIQIVLGVIMLSSPFVAGLAAAAVLGAVLIISGCLHMGAAFMAGSFGAGLVAFLWGLVIAASGGYMMMNLGLGLATLTLMLAGMFLISGVIGIFVAFRMKPVKGWGWALASGVISVVLAIMVWQQFPVSALWLPGTLVGFQALFHGITTVTVGSAARQATASA